MTDSTWFNLRKASSVIFQAMSPDGDFQGKRISMLLEADNIEDESQMDSALHGELAGKIVEHIFEQVLLTRSFLTLELRTVNLCTCLKIMGA